MKLTELWVEKYRPTTTSEYIFQNSEHEESFHDMIREKSIPNLLLSGIAGTGKSTISRILIKSINLDPCDILILNSSDENNVDTVREKIKNFVTAYSFSGFKIVVLEECDYLSANAQAVLRVLMEDYSNTTRFILLANYEHKIIPAIRSRCQTFQFNKTNKNHIAEYTANILINEKIEFELDVLDNHINKFYPDIRKIVHSLQQMSFDKILKEPNSKSDSDYTFEIIELMENNNWIKIRELLCLNVSYEEWEDVYTFLYENLDKCKKFKNKDKWDEGIITIAEHLDMHTRTANPEINASAMLIKLDHI